MADAETAHLETSHTQQAGDADAQEPGQQQDQELHGELWTTLGPLEPPANCENVTADGGVLKHVLEPGTGDKPKQFARCLGKSATHSTAQRSHQPWQRGQEQEKQLPRGTYALRHRSFACFFLCPQCTTWGAISLQAISS